MNAKERVLAAIQHTAQGHYPIQLDATDRALERLAKAWGFAATEEARLAILHNHLVFARLRERPSAEPSATTAGDTDVWGVRWATDQEGAWVLEYPLSQLTDLRCYQPPDVCGAIDWPAVEATVTRYGDQYCVVGYQNALLFERAWSLVGFERLLLAMHEDLAGVEALFDHIADEQVLVARQLATRGIAAIRTGDDWGGQRGMLFAPRLWRQLIKPRLARIWQVYQAHGIPIIHHSCGDIRLILDDLVALGLDALHPVQPEAMPLEELMARFGTELCFYGGISEQRVLPFGSEGEVRAEARRCVALLGRHGGYIAAPAQAITSDVPPQNVRALLDTLLACCGSGVLA